MRSLRLDLLFALRTLRKSPGTTGAALLMLALGIGANTAIFTVIDAAMLRPLPFAEPHRLVQLERDHPIGRLAHSSELRFDRVRRGATTLAAIAAYDDLGAGYSLLNDGRPQRLEGSKVSHDFFEVLGVRPLFGRTFQQEDDLPGAAGTVVLSHRLWRSRFGADPTALGSRLNLNGEDFEIVGIMPPRFAFPHTAELWLPFRIAYREGSAANYLRMVGRISAGRELASAEAEMLTLGRRIDAELNPENHGSKNAPPESGQLEESQGETLAVVPLQRALYGHLGTALLVLAAAVGSILLIACANLASLQLARSAARKQEMALRVALGASRRRLLRQLLTESLTLSIAGGALGVLVASLALQPLLAIGPEDIAQLSRFGLDLRVLGFALALSMATGLLSGLIPALTAWNPSVERHLRGGTKASGGHRRRLTGLALVSAELALTLVLLLAAGLLIKSFAGLRAIEPGIEPQDVLTLRVSLPEARYGSGAGLERFQRPVLEAIEAVPGVRRAALANSLPTTLGPHSVYSIPGTADAASQPIGGSVDYRSISPGYFETLGIQRLRGREFQPADSSGSEPVVIINRAFAQRHWAGVDPLGETLLLDGIPAPVRIVGVVANVRELGATQQAPAIVYAPNSQVPDELAAMLTRLLHFFVVVKAEAAAASNPGQLTTAMSEAIWSFDGEVPISHPRVMDELLSAHLQNETFNTLLLTLLSATALILTAVGIYGVLAHWVGQRRRELGIRRALGATRSQVAALVLREGAVAILGGIALGLVAAGLSARWLQSLLHDMDALDPAVYGAATALLVLLALFATYLPARRASRSDPLQSLRAE
ncbi:MAG: ABC transporter permease [Acidobacteriota bacterium]